MGPAIPVEPQPGYARPVAPAPAIPVEPQSSYALPVPPHRAEQWLDRQNIDRIEFSSDPAKLMGVVLLVQR